MTWEQVINPLGNIGLSALISLIPIIFLFYALAVVKMKGHIAAVITVLLAIGVAIFGFGMPAKYAVLSTIYGALFGLWPIGWIVVTAVFLYNLTVKTGQFEIIKDSIASVTEDRRLQALLIAFCFGAFLEGSAGFGTPVAITAAMLVGLGFNPLYAAGICLIANTAPVAFGGIGIPIITAGQVTGLDAMVISQMVGRQLPLLSVIVPLWLVWLMSGWKGAKEVMPPVLVTGFSFAITQWFSANYMSPMLPDIISSLVSMVCLILFLRVWKPASVWRFPNEPKATLKAAKHPFGVVLKAWSPFIILTILIGDWGIGSVKAFLDVVSIKFTIWGLDQMVIASGKPMAAVWTFNWLSAAGTAILITAIISAFILKVNFGQFMKLFGETLYNLRFPLVTIASVLGFAYVGNFSGLTPTLGKALTVTGAFFPLVSPLLGWIGVFITGSDTSSNALFCKMQQVTAQDIGVNEVLTVASNSSGGVAGKMISPQSIAVGAASVGLIGQEGDLFRFTVKHSILMTVILCMLAYVQAYILDWMIPEPVLAELAGAGAASGNGSGLIILALSGIACLALAVFAKLQKNNDVKISA